MAAAADPRDVRLLTELIKRLRAEVDAVQARLAAGGDNGGDNGRDDVLALAERAPSAAAMVPWAEFDPDAEGARATAAAAAAAGAAAAARAEAEWRARAAEEAERQRVLRERLFGSHGSRVVLSPDLVCVSGLANDGGNWAVVHGPVLWGPCVAVFVVEAAPAGAAVWLGASIAPPSTGASPFSVPGFALVELQSGEMLVDTEMVGRPPRWVPLGAGERVTVEVEASDGRGSPDGAVRVCARKRRFVLPGFTAGTPRRLHFCVVAGKGATVRMVSVDYSNNAPGVAAILDVPTDAGALQALASD